MYSFDCRAEHLEVVQGELDVERELEDELRDSPWSEPSRGIGFEQSTPLHLPARIDLFDAPALLSTSRGHTDSKLYPDYSCNIGREVHPNHDEDDGFPSPLHPLRAPFLTVEVDFMLGITGEDRDSGVSIKVEKPDPVLAAAGVKRRHDDDEDAFVKSEENDAPMSRESPEPSPVGAWTLAQGRVSQKKRLRLTVEKDTHVPGRVVAGVILNHLERQEYEAANLDISSATSCAHLPTPPPERHPRTRATLTESSPKLESDGLRRPRAACRGQKPPRYHIWKRYD